VLSFVTGFTPPGRVQAVFPGMAKWFRRARVRAAVRRRKRRPGLAVHSRRPMVSVQRQAGFDRVSAARIRCALGPSRVGCIRRGWVAPNRPRILCAVGPSRAWVAFGVDGLPPIDRVSAARGDPRARGLHSAWIGCSQSTAYPLHVGTLARVGYIRAWVAFGVDRLLQIDRVSAARGDLRIPPRMIA